MTAGDTYLVQLWVNDARSIGGLRTETITGGANTSANLNYGSNPDGTGPGQFIIGTFVADSTGSETLTLLGNGYAPSAQFNLLQVRNLTVAQGTWNVSTPYFGDWNTAGNWVGGIVPNGAGKTATFDNTVAGATAAITNVPVTLGVLNIASSSRIDIAGVNQGALTMQAATSGSTAQINVSGGTLDKINLPLSFNSPAAISVAANSTLEIGNPVNLNGQAVTLSGGGTLQFDVNFSASSGTLQANAGAVAIGTEAIVSPVLLDIAGNAQLSGSGTIQGDVTYESSAASLFAGKIAGAGSSLVLNAGSGSLTLTGANTYGGATEVVSGTLIAANTGAIADGTSLVVGNPAFFPAAVVPYGNSAVAGGSGLNAAAVPEPSTLALVAFGLWSAAACRRFSKRRRTGWTPKRTAGKSGGKPPHSKWAAINVARRRRNRRTH